MKLSKNGASLLNMINAYYVERPETGNQTETDIYEKVDQVASFFSGSVTKEEKDLIVRKIVEAFGVYRTDDEAISDSTAYADHDPEWFTKIKDERIGWFVQYKARLQKKQWSPRVIGEIDRSSDKIMNFLGDPRSPQFNVRGLVMGDIQSGKTANFIALCNKAADAGYRVIIVTAGIIEKLRKQTQDRLDKEFVSLLQDRQVVRLTGHNYDFRKEQGENPVHVFREDVPVLCVVKKNVSVLSHLYKWLQKGVKAVNAEGDVTLRWPLLFIDDEADNASINTNELKEEANPTRTNELIRKILKSFTRSSYVGVTATPFANVLIDPDTDDSLLKDDLFPRSFVYRLGTPSNYFGAEKLFGPGSQNLETIADIETWLPTSHKKVDLPSEEFPPSLREAIGYYLLVNGVMDVIGEEGEHIGHRSMMIHISRFVAVQNRLAAHVESYLNRLRAKIANYCGDPDKAESVPEIRALHEIWDARGLSRSCDGMRWRTFLKTRLLPGIEPIEVVSVNSGRSIKSLDYEGAEKRYIAVGGNALSRGLTLEGLVVSYFRRNTMMSDTLLQMGRWCGYRPGYEHLVRVWMPPSAIDNFEYASEISAELSETFGTIIEQNGTPRDFAFKIRKSPEAMLPTARNKMRSARPVRFPVVLAGHAVETPRMHNDAQVIRDNDAAVISMVRDSVGRLDPRVGTNGIRYLRDVPAERISKMLSGFKAGMMSYGFMIPQIAEYISKLGSAWDVAIPEDKRGVKIEGLPFPVRRSVRTLDVGEKEIMISGTKLKVTPGGVMRYALTEEEARKVIRIYREGKGDPEANPSDKVFLAAAKRLGHNPLLVLQYVAKGDLTEASREPEAEAFFALSFGFPGSDDDQAEEVFYFSKRAYEEALLQDSFTGETED